MGLAVGTLPPSWMARSSPAEADADASSWLAASRCAELSAAPMTNNHTNELFFCRGGRKGKKKEKKKADTTAFPGELKIILSSFLYSVSTASRFEAQQRSSAPGWPGSGVMRSEDHQTLFRTVWAASPQLSHGCSAFCITGCAGGGHLLRN